MKQQLTIPANQSRKHSGRGSSARSLIISLVLATLSLIVMLGSCALNQATGKRQLNLISESQEIAMGQQADSEIVSSLGLYNDADLQKYVQELGSKLAQTSERPNLPWTFRVVDDPTVNAFALPGGFIYVTRGLLTYVKNEAELSGVIGHEIGHVTAQHSVHRMSTQQLTQVGIVAGMMIKPELQKYGQILNTGLGLLYLKYSRDDESQADHLGFRYMVNAGKDPRQMIGVFDMLGRVSDAGGGGRLPEWLVTHPNPENRSANFQKEIDTLSLDMNRMSVNQDSYLNRIDGVVFGDNPREGFFRSNHFYHPEMKFDLEFPAGWQTVNQKSVVAAVSADQDAVLQVTMADGTSASSAASKFFGQEGMTTERRETNKINGLTAVSAVFRAQTENGVLQGKASFIEYDGQIYQLLGYTSEQLWTKYDNVLIAAMSSFRRLTDVNILRVQPMHLKIVTLTKTTSLAQMIQQEKSPVSIETLAIINQVESNTTLKSGERVKTVTGVNLAGQ